MKTSAYRPSAIIVRQPESICRICGCTDERGCILVVSERRVTKAGVLHPEVVSSCHWIEPDLCSNPNCLVFRNHVKPGVRR